MGPIGGAILAICAGALLATRHAPSRSVRRLTWYVTGTAAASLLIHAIERGASGRASPMMLLDAAGLYVMALVAVCRWRRAPWLYALMTLTALQCVSHLAYVAGAISGDAHTLALNLLFLGQAATLALARSAAPDIDLSGPLTAETGNEAAA